MGWFLVGQDDIMLLWPIIPIRIASTLGKGGKFVLKSRRNSSAIMFMLCSIIAELFCLLCNMNFPPVARMDVVLL